MSLQQLPVLFKNNVWFHTCIDLLFSKLAPPTLQFIPKTPITFTSFPCYFSKSLFMKYKNLAGTSISLILYVIVITTFITFILLRLTLELIESLAWNEKVWLKFFFALKCLRKILSIIKNIFKQLQDN